MSEKPRLLVVDDEPVICQACHRVFSRQGFDVEESTDAREGLSLATQGDYCAILLDIKMPQMDGIQFLEALRKKKPDVPVMIMTGYPSVPNAASAVRLGASDYITKPFTPEAITQTVRRILTNHQAIGQEALGAEPSPPQEDLARTEGRLFFNEAWLQPEADGSACVGAVLSGLQTATAEAVRLPSVGEVVYQGLPLAGLTTADGSEVVVPSPISGVVVSVNESLDSDPSVVLSDPCGKGWIACVCTTRLEEELAGCKPRHVILVNADEATAGEQRETLTTLGCEVQVAGNWEELAPLAADPTFGVLVFDAASFGDAGPELLRRINASAGPLKVVVVAASPCRWETAYRQQRIFYYAVAPFADGEIVEILHAAFRPQPQPRPEGHWKAPAERIGGVRVTNHGGHKVQLLAAPGLLCRNHGLGRLIIEKLSDRAAPITLMVGDHDVAPMAVLKAAGMYDRVMVLLAKDTGRLPGSLVRDTKAEYVSASKENTGKITTLVVQPGPSADGLAGLDDRTTEALAEHLVQEMVSY